MLAEQSGSAARNYEGKGYHNWLNIARTDTGDASGAHSGVWRNPESAARASAEWMRGRGQISREYGRPASGIMNILHAAGQGANAEIHAIATSGWASSGYNGGNDLRSLYGQLSGDRELLKNAALRQVGRTSGKEQVEAEKQGAPRFNLFRALGLVGQESTEKPEEGPQFEAAKLNPVMPQGMEQRVQEGERIPEPLPEEVPKPPEGYEGSTGDLVQKNWELMADKFDQESAIRQPPNGEPPPANLPGMVHQGPTKLGGFLPASAKLTMGRWDQGQDGATNPGGPIIAPGNGVVLMTKDNPGGFGYNYPVVKFTSGPLAGREVYIGHTHSVLRAGEKFNAGQIISKTGFGTEREGNARTPGWFEIGFWPPGGMTAGSQIGPLIGGRNA